MSWLSWLRPWQRPAPRTPRKKPPRRYRPTPETLETRELLTTGMPMPDHVVIVVEENHSFAQIANSASAPYLNSLATGPNAALFTDSLATTHPSLPNYLEMFSGAKQGVTTDTIPATFFTTPNLGHELLAAGRTFTGYSESLPAVGYTGSSSGAYVRRHAPWVNWQGTGVNQLPGADNQPFSSFPTDFTKLPTVSYVIPNLNNDMHNGTVAQGDTWLKNNLGNYVTWAQTHNSMLIVTFDEGTATSNQVFTLFVGPMVKKGTYSQWVNHDRVLRTLEDMYNLPYAGNSAKVQPISNVWTAASTATTSVPAAATTTTTTTAPATTALPTFGAKQLKGDINTTLIREDSGLAASRVNTNVLWTHNDSGDTSRVFAINTNGKLLGTYNLWFDYAAGQRVPAHDYEDIAIGPGPSAGKSYVYVADIGDNSSSRSSVQVYRFLEPTVTTGLNAPAAGSAPTINVTGVQEFDLRYCDIVNGVKQYCSVNAESLMIDPVTGDLFIVAKGAHPGDAANERRVYWVPARNLQTPGTTPIDAMHVATIVASDRSTIAPTPTGADVSADGSMIAIKNYGEVFIWMRAPGQSVIDVLKAQPQAPIVTGMGAGGEAIAFGPKGGGFYTSTEGLNQPLYWWPKG